MQNIDDYRKLVSKRLLLILVFTILTIILFFASLAVGTRSLSLGDVYTYFFDHIEGVTYNRTNDYQAWFDDNIIWNYRVPRAIFAIVSGAGLAVAGACMQSVMKNPLADPYTTGISSGAMLGVALAMVLGFSAGSGGINGFGTVLNAMIFSMIPVAVIYLMSPFLNRSPATLILAGTAVSFLFSSLTSIILVSTDEENLAGVYRWMVGTFGDLSWDSLPITFVVCILGIIVTMLLSNKLNLMSLDDKDAKALGLDAEKLRLVCLLVLSFMVASIISFVGVIGFVGLVIPHIVRLLIGSDNRFVVPASIFVGATFLLACDIISRAIDLSTTIPVGVVTAFIGSPIFVYLVIRRQRQLW